MNVTSLLSPNGNAVANQFQLSMSGGYVFQSYQSLVAISGGGSSLHGRQVINQRYYKYSNTTTKYTTVFFNCRDAKELHSMVKNGTIELVSQKEFDKLLEEIK